jgi:hypothetical protein
MRVMDEQMAHTLGKVERLLEVAEAAEAFRIALRSSGIDMAGAHLRLCDALDRAIKSGALSARGSGTVADTSIARPPTGS